jgi:aryl-alcohol dehydrogenase-like predicted oxidoreductase
MGTVDSMATTRALHETFTIGGDLEVRRLGFGAMRIVGPGVWGEPQDRANSLAVTRRAIELGVQLVDTADSYGPYVSEELLREALAPYPPDVVVATKAGLTRSGPGEWHAACDPDRLRACCDESLRRLGVEQIDLYQLHTVDSSVPFEESVGAFRDLRDAGKVRHVGLSNVRVEHIERARELVPIVTVQNRYSCADRGSEEVLEYCEREGIGFIPWFPLAAGELAEAGGAVAQVAKELDATTSQVALAWLLARSPVMLPIPGTGSIPHLEENLQAAGLRLSDEQFERIDRAGSVEP